MILVGINPDVTCQKCVRGLLPLIFAGVEFVQQCAWLRRGDFDLIQ
jgi:hypothetical protein